jgi:hypothetical protein
VSTSHTQVRTPLSVNTLLSRVSQSLTRSTLGRVAEQRQTQRDWRAWLKNSLSSELDAHVTGVVASGANLTVFADSSAWSARLRFAVAEFEAEIRAQNAEIQKVVVKVMPRR